MMRFLRGFHDSQPLQGRISLYYVILGDVSKSSCKQETKARGQKIKRTGKTMQETAAPSHSSQPEKVHVMTQIELYVLHVYL